MFDYQYDKDKIIHELGIEASDETFKQQMLTRIEQVLDERMSVRITEELTDEQMQEFNQAESRSAAQTILRQCVPSINAMYKEEFDSIVEDLKIVLDA